MDVPPEFMASISTYYQGYVKGIKLIEGEFVNKGQLLFVLENPEYLQMQQDFLEAKEQLAYLKSEYDRQKTLANENISAQKNYLKAKSDYGVTSTRYEALKKKLSLMGISTASLDNSNLHSTIRITAPISGYVSSINVSQGKVLSPNEVALIITNTEHLHVEIMVFEKDILKVVKGQKIHYKFSGSSKELGGEVHLVSRAVTQGAGAISVHGHINNSDELKNMYPKRFKKEISKPTMEVKNLWPDRLLEGVNFNIYAGEILGLAGQLGSGTGDILAAIAGSTRTRGGELIYKGKTFLPKSPKEAIDSGIAYCSDDRKHDGLFLGRPISENLSSAALKSISKNGIRLPKSENEMVTENAIKFTIDPSRIPQEAGVLSGGNQQKVALAKWLAIHPDVILVNEPTRGVDVGARAEIYQKLRELADDGAAIVVASTDIQEITNLPDRVITIYRGIQIGEIGLEDMSAATILEEITNPFNEKGLQGDEDL